MVFEKHIHKRVIPSDAVEDLMIFLVMEKRLKGF